MWHEWERREKCSLFWWDSPKERDHSEDGRRGWEDRIRVDVKEIVCGWGGGVDPVGSG
jgi:hypothetical protein